MRVENFRLPANTHPVNYDLLFEVDLNKFTFSGKEEINLETLQPTSTIVLNSSGLDIIGAKLSYNGKSIKPKIRIDNKKETLTLEFKERIKGGARLFLDFSGKLNNDLLGFYRSKYTSNGKEKYLATTQFEAPYARRCFPCFDEPDYKATFDVSMRIDKNLQAISNMPIKEEISEGNKKIVKFYRTPKMSTYLLYLAVGDFEFLEDKLDSILVRIATVPGKKNQAKFALDLTKKFLSYFQEYSGIQYPLPKLDSIALPDFAAGAMENWGAITYREIYLLFDPKATSTAIKKRIAMIIAHELWHQWSGDLVTMRWWNDLWLNESFATFMAYKAVDNFFPEWNMWEDFVGDETEHALNDDSLKSTHPIEVQVRNPHEIEEIFDAISYSKGGSILRMLENYLGKETFRKGVSNYLSANRYSNATSEDLWTSLSNAANKPIKEMMVSWIRQPGYPLIEAQFKNRILSLKQMKFSQNNEDARWLIPLVIKSSEDDMTEILDRTEKKMPMQGKWFKLNYGQSGFYRTKYSTEDLARLTSLIPNKGLPALDRWGIQNDLFELSKNGKTDLNEYLDIIKFYSNEDSYLVLGDIYSNVRNIYFVFCKESFWPKVWPKFKNHFVESPKRVLNKLGWEPKDGENQKDALLRDASIKYLAFTEEQDVIKKGLEKFKKYYGNKIELHPDIKSSIFYIAAITGNEKTCQKLLDLYLKTQSPEEKRLFLIALGQFRNSDLLKRVLDFSLTNKVRTQDLPIIFSSVASNPDSREIFLPWVKKNWKKLKTYEKSGKIFINLLESFISSNADKEKEKELRKFFDARPVKYKMTINRSFERLQRNIKWIERNKSLLTNYFSAA
ncbi:MAG: M1 family metallopeptidase [Candidatus Aenigmatarchaeota archaeon]